MITTLLAFLLTLGVLIVVHEYGHYRVAVACGVKVLRFSVGFGRVIWRRQSAPEATEFVLCALPLGGYVRMLDEREFEGGQVLRPGEVDQAFNRKSLRQRAAIVAAGPAANLALAVLLYAVSQWIGVDEPRAVLSAPSQGSLAQSAGLRAGDRVVATATGDRAVATTDEAWSPVASYSELRWQITQAALAREALRLQVTPDDREAVRVVLLDLVGASAGDVDSGYLQRLGFGAPFSEPVLGDTAEGSPARKAGLLNGDRVVSVDGQAVPDAATLRDWIRRNTGAASDGQPQAMVWRVLRDGRELELTVTPGVADDNGERVGRVGAYIGAPPAMVTVRSGPWDGLVGGAQRTWEVSLLTVQMLGRMLIGEASLKNLSGPITIADYAGQSVQLGLAYYLGFLALVSVSLGVLNLLPLPMLDGGHLMYYLFEGLTGRPVSDEWLRWLHRGGALVLLLMMSLALSNDVARLLGLH